MEVKSENGAPSTPAYDYATQYRENSRELPPAPASSQPAIPASATARSSPSILEEARSVPVSPRPFPFQPNTFGSFAAESRNYNNNNNSTQNSPHVMRFAGAQPPPSARSGSAERNGSAPPNHNNNNNNNNRRNRNRPWYHNRNNNNNNRGGYNHHHHHQRRGWHETRSEQILSRLERQESNIGRILTHQQRVARQQDDIVQRFYQNVPAGEGGAPANPQQGAQRRGREGEDYVQAPKRTRGVDASGTAVVVAVAHRHPPATHLCA